MIFKENQAYMIQIKHEGDSICALGTDFLPKSMDKKEMRKYVIQTFVKAAVAEGNNKLVEGFRPSYDEVRADAKKRHGKFFKDMGLEQALILYMEKDKDFSIHVIEADDCKKAMNDYVVSKGENPDEIISGCNKVSLDEDGEINLEKVVLTGESPFSTEAPKEEIKENDYNI